MYNVNILILMLDTYQTLALFYDLHLLHFMAYPTVDYGV